MTSNQDNNAGGRGELIAQGMARKAGRLQASAGAWEALALSASDGSRPASKKQAGKLVVHGSLSAAIKPAAGIEAVIAFEAGKQKVVAQGPVRSDGSYELVVPVPARKRKMILYLQRGGMRINGAALAVEPADKGKLRRVDLEPADLQAAIANLGRPAASPRGDALHRAREKQVSLLALRAQRLNDLVERMQGSDD